MIGTKTRYEILDCLDLKKANWGIRQNNNKDDEFIKKLNANTNIRKDSERNGNSRKSSINPSNVDYIKRSRFNSRADELKTTQEENPDLMDELVNSLGADIQFYQCFRLTEEEFEPIKKANMKFINEFQKHGIRNIRRLQEDFIKLIDEVPCEKFIAVGHLIEIMFSLNVSRAESLKNYLLEFYQNKILDGEDIKHG